MCYVDQTHARTHTQSVLITSTNLGTYQNDIIRTRYGKITLTQQIFCSSVSCGNEPTDIIPRHSCTSMKMQEEAKGSGRIRIRKQYRRNDGELREMLLRSGEDPSGSN